MLAQKFCKQHNLCVQNTQTYIHNSRLIQFASCTIVRRNSLARLAVTRSAKIFRAPWQNTFCEKIKLLYLNFLKARARFCNYFSLIIIVYIESVVEVDCVVVSSIVTRGLYVF